MNKKPVLIITACDVNNFAHAVKFLNSLTKFHNPRDVDIMLITNETRKAELDKLPKGIILEDLTPYIKDDPMFWYRQKPIIAENYIDQYELVLGMDVDQIVCAPLDYIFNTKDYDIAVVVNWNRVDPQQFGFVEINRLGIPPPEYYNCGLVAMRSAKFVHHWKMLCFSPEFNQMQYKEQDVLNILCHFGNYNVRNLDAGDGVANMHAWWGLISKGEWNRAELRDKMIVVPQGFGDTPFPPVDMELRVLHFAGGQGSQKFNYKTHFNDEISAYLDYLIASTK